MTERERGREGGRCIFRPGEFPLTREGANPYVELKRFYSLILLCGNTINRVCVRMCARMCLRCVCVCVRARLFWGP